jgi:hypothetical protein
MTSFAWEMTPNGQGANIHMLIAIVRGGISSLIAEVSEDHIRLHMLSSGKARPSPMNSLKI